MDLLPYIESVRVGVANASSLADEQTQHVAERLGTAIESSTRLALIQALSDAAGSISAEMAPSSVELRMVGQDPEFVVLIQTAEAEPTLLLPGAEAESGATGESATSEPDDEPVARITLRLQQSVKARVDEMASSEGISTNAWLIRAVMDALADRSGSRRAWPQAPTPPIPPVPPVPPMPPSPKLIFGETDPFGPEGVFVEKGVFGEKGVFAPKGPFGPGGMFADRLKESWREMRRSRGNVQGWVR